MEGILTKLMYEIPSDKSITRVTITEDAVRGTGEALIVRGEKQKRLVNQ